MYQLVNTREVIDTGIGIAAHEVARIFDPFERLGAESTDVEGTGLGLTLSKRLVEAMDGQLIVEPGQSCGTTFSLEFPAAAAPQTRTAPSEEAAQVTTGPVRGPARNVLYVEDNPSNIALVEMILAERPEVTLIVSTQGGLAIELARQHRPALILLDLNLPDISGEEVLSRLRSDARTAGIHIVVVSADATTSQVARLRRLGADDYLTKPFGLKSFLGVIDGFSASAHAQVTSAEPPAPPAVLDTGAIGALRELAGRATVGESAVRDLVKVFLEDALGQLAVLQTAADDQDLTAVTRQAHALRGASGGVGAGELAGLCRQLEATAKHGNANAVRCCMPRLRQAVEDARAALAAEFGV